MSELEINVHFAVEKYLRELLQNLPEYSLSLDCIDWDYDNMVFTFRDRYEGNNPTYTKNIADFRDGLQLYVDSINQDKVREILDPGNCDAIVVDCLVQYTIFGEVVYG